MSRKKQKRDKPYKAARKAVYARAGGRCEAPVHDVHCSGWCEQTHHIEGREGPDPHRLSNLIGLSAACHRLAHARKEWALESGLSRSRHGGQA